MSLHFVSKQ